MINKVICWWSGGITSAVACKLAIDLYGKENCLVIFIDTFNEDDDTYRFLNDCEKWYGIKIDSITAIGVKYQSIQDVWIMNLSLNVASGAICSSELKRAVREKWQRENPVYKNQVFGFDLDEPKRLRSMKLNHPKTKPIFPLWLYGYSKEDCIQIVIDAGIDIPNMYKLGFRNNNCFKTGCVQGGFGYWQKMERERYFTFYNMAMMEHKLTNLKGKPVTMLRTSISKEYNERYPVFLIPHPDYTYLPNFKDQKGREPEPLTDCNGFCGINDLEERSKTEKEINYQQSLF